jgi:hypothetical protein
LLINNEINSWQEEYKHGSIKKEINQEQLVLGLA